MFNTLVPEIGQWYIYQDNDQQFFITAIDEDNAAIEAQHYDGNLEEFSFEQWQDLEIELCAEPENWSGAVDVSDIDEFGT